MTPAFSSSSASAASIPPYFAAVRHGGPRLPKGSLEQGDPVARGRGTAPPRQYDGARGAGANPRSWLDARSGLLSPLPPSPYPHSLYLSSPPYTTPPTHTLHYPTIHLLINHLPLYQPLPSTSTKTTLYLPNPHIHHTHTPHLLHIPQPISQHLHPPRERALNYLYLQTPASPRVARAVKSRRRSRRSGKRRDMVRPYLKHAYRDLLQFALVRTAIVPLVFC